MWAFSAITLSSTAESERDLSVNEVLQDGVHLEVGGMLVEHQALPGPQRQGARAPSVVVIPDGRDEHELDGTHRLGGAPLDVERDRPDEVHAGLAVGEITGRLAERLLGQPQRLVVLPALGALQQPSHGCRVPAHAVNLQSVHVLIGRLGCQLTRVVRTRQRHLPLVVACRHIPCLRNRFAPVERAVPTPLRDHPEM